MEAEQMGGFIILGSLWLLAVFGAYRLGYFRMPKVCDEPDLSILHVLGAFLIVLFVVAVVAPLGLVSYQLITTGQVQLGEAVDSSFYGWFSLSLYFMLAAALGYYCVRVIGSKPTGRLCFGTGETHWVRHSFIGMGTWFLAIFPVSMIHGALDKLVEMWQDTDGIEQLAVQQLKQTADSELLFLLTALSMVILIPFLEELLFRGLLQTWMRRYLGRVGAVLLTSVFFALAHYSSEQGMTNISLLGTLYAFSLFLGFLYERQQSLIGPYALHAVFNGVSVIGILAQS